MLKKMERVMEIHKPFCLWIYGKPNSGKTTLSYELLQDKIRNCVLIDGDQYREYVETNLKFSKEDILKNNLSAANLVNFLMKQGFNVIVAMVTPYAEGRGIIENTIVGDKYFIWLDASRTVRSSRPNFRDENSVFECSEHYDIWANTETVNKEVLKVKVYEMLKQRKNISWKLKDKENFIDEETEEKIKEIEK